MSTTEGKIVSVIKAPGPNPQGMAWDGECLWVSDRANHHIYRLNAKTGDQLVALAFEGELAGVAWDGAHVWVADRSTRTISQIDPESGAMPLSLHVDQSTGDLSGLHFDKECLWYGLARMGQLRRVRPTDGRFSKALPAKADVGGLALVGRAIWYTEPEAGMVHKIDANNGAMLVSYKVGGQPTTLCHDGECFWIADAIAGELRRMTF